MPDRLQQTIIPIVWQTENLLAAVEYAAKKLFFSIDRDNMNRRSLTESLDDKIMGEVATVAVVEYLRSVGLQAASYDQFRLDRFQRPDPGWDILLGDGTYRWVEAADKSGGRPASVKTASVKSSRLPTGDGVKRAIAKRDFKIFAKPNQPLPHALTADIEMQIYFERNSSWLPPNSQISADEILACTHERGHCQPVLDKLQIKTRFGSCYLTAWNWRKNILRDSATLKPQTWNSRHAGYTKQMWCAPLKNGRGFKSLSDLRHID